LLRKLAGLVGLLAALATAQAQEGSLDVVAIRVNGVEQTQAVRLRVVVPPSREASEQPLAVGDPLKAGIEIEVPSRTVIVLRSAAGNLTELGAGSRFRVESTSRSGEWTTLLAGRVRMQVMQALSFFNVEFGGFAARVRGTDFELEVDADRAGAARVTSGVVHVLRDVPTQLGEGRPAVPMLASERLQADAHPAARWPASPAAQRYASPEAATARYRDDLAAAEQAQDFDARCAALNNLGLAAMAAGRPADARTWFQLLLDAATLAGDVPWHARALNNIAAADIRLQRWAAARDTLQQALALNRRFAPALGARRIAQNEGNLGVVWRRLGDETQAREATLRSIELYRGLDGPADSAGLASNLENLGLLARREAAAALDWHQQALAMRLRVYGSAPHPDVASSLGHVGSTLCAAARIDEGLDHLERARAMRQAQRVPAPDPDLAQAHEALSACWARAAAAGRPGAAARAVEHLNQAKAERGP
jgi:tetratricopeptide (TPR) repeat protein